MQYLSLYFFSRAYKQTVIFSLFLDRLYFLRSFPCVWFINFMFPFFLFLSLMLLIVSFSFPERYSSFSCSIIFFLGDADSCFLLLLSLRVFPVYSWHRFMVLFSLCDTNSCSVGASVAIGSLRDADSFFFVNSNKVGSSSTISSVWRRFLFLALLCACSIVSTEAHPRR